MEELTLTEAPSLSERNSRMEDIFCARGLRGSSSASSEMSGLFPGTSTIDLLPGSISERPPTAGGAPPGGTPSPPPAKRGSVGQVLVTLSEASEPGQEGVRRGSGGGGQEA
eukprot:1196230-Prorocentrum_minimum.AAC.9